MKTLEIVSYWLRLKKLIEKSNVYDDEAIMYIDNYFMDHCKKELELENGKPES